MNRDQEILEGVVWCSTCGNWYPIEDGLLELLAGALAYADDQSRFWTTHVRRLKALGLKQPLRHNQVGVQAQRKQQTHFDWYASNSQQTYTTYEQTPFWQATDALAFDEWREEIQPARWLLDVGCAQGRSTFKIMDINLRVVAFDISRELIKQAIARYKGEKWSADATFFVADATHYPFISGCFDYVLIYGVLHHLPNPGSTCQEIARVLKPGGVYFGLENNRTVFRVGFDLLQRLQPLWHEEAGAQPLIAKQQFQTWLKAAGLHASIWTRVFLPPHFINYLNVKSARWILDITDRLFGSIPFLKHQGGLILVKGIRKVS